MALKAWYTFNNNYNNQGCGDANLTVTTAPTYVDGKTGKALNQGGFKWTAAQTEKILNNKALSICFWVYIDLDEGSTSNRAMFFGNDSMNTLGGRQFSLFNYPTSNDLHYSWQNCIDGNYTSICGGVYSGCIPSRKWTHIAVTYNNPTGTIYINGEKKTTFTCTYNTDSFAFDTQVIWNNNYHKFNDYRIYDECLSDNQIKEIAKGLIAHYKLEPESWNPNLAVPNPMVNGGATSFTFDSKQNMYTIISPVGDSSWGYGLVIGGTTKNKCLVPYNSSYRFSFEVLVPTEHVLIVDYNNFSNDTSQWNPSGNDNDLTSARLTNTKTIPANTWTKCVFGSKNANTSNTTQTDLYENSKIGIRTADDTESVTWYLRNFKFELGDTVTDYVDFGCNPMDFITTDVSGNGYNISKTGSLNYNADSARYSSSLQFGGTCADYLYRPIFDFLKSPFTFNCWIYQTSATSPSSGNTGNTLQFVMGQGRDCGYAGFALCSANGYARLYLGTQTNGTYYSINDNTINLLNGWHMLTGTFDGSTAKLYVDGVVKGTKDSAIDPSWEATSGFVLGKMSYNYASATTAYFPFVGSISDSKIYATALSADEILKMYKNSGIIDNKNNVYAYEFKEE